MQIDYNILITYGGYAKKLTKGQVVFHEGDTPVYYYQVITGAVKMFSISEDGKELMLAIFTAGHSFGEPPLFLGKNYPASAEAIADTVIVKITKAGLLAILKDYHEICFGLLTTFAERIYSKATITHILNISKPEERLRLFFENLSQRKKTEGKLLIPYTRQQIADFTGLRVETVIRTMLRMCKEGKLKMVDHKVYY